MNISPGDVFNPEVLATLPTDQQIVVQCYTGQSASQVTSALNMAGYDASNLVFGMSAWTTDPDVYKVRFEPEMAKGYTTTTEPFEATGEYALPSPLAATVADAANTYFNTGMKTTKADTLFENLNDGDASNDPYILSVRSQARGLRQGPSARRSLGGSQGALYARRSGDTAHRQADRGLLLHWPDGQPGDIGAEPAGLRR